MVIHTVVQATNTGLPCISDSVIIAEHLLYESGIFSNIFVHEPTVIPEVGFWRTFL